MTQPETDPDGWLSPDNFFPWAPEPAPDDWLDQPAGGDDH
jgi:hypothetical protein